MYRKFFSTGPTLETRLKDAKEEDVPYFSFKGRTVLAKPVNIYDGDTFSIIFEMTPGSGELIKYRCRCYGYDTAEMKPCLDFAGREEEIQKAKAAKQRLTELLSGHPSGLVKVECMEFDKYGRILVKVWNQVSSISVNDMMVAEGHGNPYFGGTKE